MELHNRRGFSGRGCYCHFQVCEIWQHDFVSEVSVSAHDMQYFDYHIRFLKSKHSDLNVETSDKAVYAPRDRLCQVLETRVPDSELSVLFAQMQASVRRVLPVIENELTRLILLREQYYLKTTLLWN